MRRVSSGVLIYGAGTLPCPTCQPISHCGGRLIGMYRVLLSRPVQMESACMVGMPPILASQKVLYEQRSRARTWKNDVGSSSKRSPQSVSEKVDDCDAKPGATYTRVPGLAPFPESACSCTATTDGGGKPCRRRRSRNVRNARSSRSVASGMVNLWLICSMMATSSGGGSVEAPLDAAAAFVMDSAASAGHARAVVREEVALVSMSSTTAGSICQPSGVGGAGG